MEAEKIIKRKILLSAEAGALVNDDIYFFSSEYNLLYRVHMPDFAVSIISRIPCDNVLAYKWFRKMRYWNGKLILIPSCAERVWIYDLDSGEWMDIIIDYPQISLKFWGTVIYQDNIFLFGAAYPAILKINLIDYSLTYLKMKYPSDQKKKEPGLFFTDVVRVNNIAFSAVSISNHVVWLNLDTFEYGWQKVGSSDNQYAGIVYDGENFWISSWQRGKIVKWDGVSNGKEFEVPEEIANRKYYFTAIICDGNKKRCLTLQDGKSLEIVSNMARDLWISLTEETKKYIHWEAYENGIIVLMREDAGIDVKWKGKWIKGKCEITYEEFRTCFTREALMNGLIYNGLLRETKVFEVNDYIEEIAERQEISNDLCEKNQAGKRIWEIIE